MTVHATAWTGARYSECNKTGGGTNSTADHGRESTKPSMFASQCKIALLVNGYPGLLHETTSAHEAHLELHGNEAIASYVLELAEGGLLDEAFLCGHQQVVILPELLHW